MSTYSTEEKIGEENMYIRGDKTLTDINQSILFLRGLKTHRHLIQAMATHTHTHTYTHTNTHTQTLGKTFTQTFKPLHSHTKQIHKLSNKLTHSTTHSRC